MPGTGSLLLADLVAWRGLNGSEGDTGLSDHLWLTELISVLGDADIVGVPMMVGYCSEGTSLEKLILVMEENLAPDVFVSLSRGLDKKRVERFSASGEVTRRDPGEAFEIRETVSPFSSRVSLAVLELILKGMIRKPLLSYVNTVILLEDALIEMTGGSGRQTSRRNLAIDHALMRILDSMNDLQSDDIEDFTTIFRAIGNMSRLNNSISDGLDRVQSYAAKAVKDADIAEAGRLAGRPEVRRFEDIRTAARQCRLFRDRERA